MVALLTLIACNSPEAPDEHTLSAARMLVRASLDVRGVRPTPEELQRVLDDPGALEGHVAGFLDHPGFALRIKEMFAPAFRTRIDDYPYLYDRPDLTRAIGEEPLNLVAQVAVSDRPFTDVVLAEHTVIDPVLQELWPLQELQSGTAEVPGTVLARYTDGRPHAGVLSTNAMWWRHSSTLENANRGRANALSRGLLCESFLDRPIDFPRDIDLSDSETIHEAIRTNPGCTACHASLDPIASYLWGFMYEGEGLDAMAEYSPAGERDWQRTTGRAPGFFGQAGNTLRDLGVQIARDPRFVSCAVQRVYEGMLGRKAHIEDDGALAEHRDAFIRSDLSLRSLVASVVDDARYHGTDVAPIYGGQPGAVELKVISPEQLASELEATTGYRMTLGDRDVLRTDFGLRALAGGSDQGSATLPSTGLVLVHRRLAEGAASAIVDGTVTGGVITEVADDWGRAPTYPELAALVAATASIPIADDGDEVEALLGLWNDLEAVSDASTAWKGLLTALLADPARLVY